MEFNGILQMSLPTPWIELQWALQRFGGTWPQKSLPVSPSIWAYAQRRALYNKVYNIIACIYNISHLYNITQYIYTYIYIYIRICIIWICMIYIYIGLDIMYIYNLYNVYLYNIYIFLCVKIYRNRFSIPKNK